MQKRVTIIRADNSVEILKPDKKPTLEQMQKWVGGYIETLDVRYEGKAGTMVVNEEGRIYNLSPNLVASEIAGLLILGDVFILEGWGL